MSRYSQLRLGSLRDGSFLNSSSTQWQRLAVAGALLAIANAISELFDFAVDWGAN